MKVNPFDCSISCTAFKYVNFIYPSLNELYHLFSEKAIVDKYQLFYIILLQWQLLILIKQVHNNRYFLKQITEAFHHLLSFTVSFYYCLLKTIKDLQYFRSFYISKTPLVPTISFSVLMDSSINQTVSPFSTGGYTCIPSIPNGEVTTSGQLVISGRLDVSDEGTYRCTSSEINGSIVINLVATGESISLFSL